MARFVCAVFFGFARATGFFRRCASRRVRVGAFVCLRRRGFGRVRVGVFVARRRTVGGVGVRFFFMDMSSVEGRRQLATVAREKQDVSLCRERPTRDVGRGTEHTESSTQGTPAAECHLPVVRLLSLGAGSLGDERSQTVHASPRWV
jgi:hypothetical protein